MLRITKGSVRLFCVVLALASLGFAAGNDAEKKQKPNSLPTDWSHRHLVFSRPASADQAARVQQDVRYQQQQLRHEVHPYARLEKGRPISLPPARRLPKKKLHPDWSVNLGSGGGVGAARFPAKFSFDLSVANCGLAVNPDFVIYGNGLPGASGTQASIEAFTNLYSGCPSGPIPAYYWRYNTGGKIISSPVLSLDGSQVAFVQSNGVTSSMVLLKWNAVDGVPPAAPKDIFPVATIGDYVSCPTLPCMAELDLGALNTNSSVYYDYGNDMAWVGDDAGKLHEYTGVFKGTPTEVIGGGWPAAISTAPLTSPVHDDHSSYTFVNDSAGFLYRVTGSGVATASGQLDFGAGLVEGPMIDSSAGSVYVFSSRDKLGFAGVFQLSTSFASNDTGLESLVGLGTTTTTPLYNGAFDNNYLSSATPTGNMYVCGNPGGKPALYQIPILSGVMGVANPGPVLSGTDSTACSPVTDVYNPVLTGAGLPQEWVFASVQGDGNPLGCATVSCVMNFKDTSWQPNTVYNNGQEILDSNLNIQVAVNSGGTSGALPPVWNIGVYSPTSDGSVHWRNQGALTAITPDTWAALNTYSGGSRILDTNGNIEIAEPGGGTSDITPPTWGMNAGDSVTDGTVNWVNLGAITVFGLKESGGTSGIIIDNMANLSGASQIYFSTLKDMSCGRDGVGACAVQASQQDLQ